MPYSDITFQDKNPVKRWLQQRRMVSATRLGKQSRQPAVICDYGAGNGELCKQLAEHLPEAKFICYEPSPVFLEEAKENLKAVPNTEFYQDIRQIPQETVDLLFCLEVFEHLPEKETHEALQTISKLLKPGGEVVIGVPVEVGIPALYKGIFRMTRRFGAYDASPKNVFLSVIGSPPQDRPRGEIEAGFGYHFPHTGFDYREFSKTLVGYFDLKKVSTSPFHAPGTLLMPEVYFSLEKPDNAAA
ncbi:class I SAM-dependent methyltransferase [Gimesia sp.]|uniref:class I SAM-dependent methyltransferase n=1 Tax=Gimesia sp. TaxID=2024833 RepID=UPI000C54FF25|nr:class I SAM-dependent methyltransferase [Gimesia sp.]MAX38164.1 SAM-dependent methyltransferase [Gimesia sp.]HBL48202.1 class I SAM-dependent methyltransferase [Planctomycetaceae bacterium]|tara:strand:+ start:2413 stop:3144 length:732 start_codon:yes stop_codon:yes gene_type:complete